MSPTWLKGCLVCNADLVTTVKNLVEKGMTKNQVWDRLVEDQEETLGEVLYSKNALKIRYHRNTTPKTTTAKKSVETTLANGSENFTKAKERPDLAEAIRLGTIKPAEAHRLMKKDEVKEKTQAMPEGKHRVIYADPPWKYNDAQAVKGDYGTGTGAASGHYPLA